MFTRHIRFGLLAATVLGLAAVLLLLSVLGWSGGLARAVGPLYVALTGSDAGNDCTNSTAPCATIQRAVDVAAPSDEIRVATGVYTGVQARAGVTQVVYISQTVTVRGGYTTTNWITSYPLTQPTLLNAQSLGRVVFITGTAGALENLTVINGNSGSSTGGGVYADNALTLTNVSIMSNTAMGNGGGGVFAKGATTLIGGLFQSNISFYGGLYTWDSLTLTGTQFINNIGGGAYVGGAATLIGGLFLGNTGAGGGGLWVDGALTLSSTQFISNTAAQDGGGVHASIATLNGGLFQANVSSGLGGGVYASGAVTLISTHFVSNAAITGGGIFAFGKITSNGGLFQKNFSMVDGGGLFTFDTLTLTDTQFISNTATVDGGGAHSYLEGVAVSGGLFQSNVGVRGGGLWVGAALTLSGTQFISNTAINGGGLFASNDYDSLIQNALFRGNVASDKGGGLLFNYGRRFHLLANRIIDNHATNGGGGVYAITSSLFLTNNVLAANTTLTGAAALDMGKVTGFSSSPSSVQGAHNTFVAGSTGNSVAVIAGRDLAGDTITLTNSIVHGFAVGAQTGPFAATIALDGVLWSDVTTATQGAGIAATNAYTGDAAFVNEAARDYHLTIASDAIDRGVNASVSDDVDGDARPFGSAPDLGADESTATSFKIYLPLVTRNLSSAVARTMEMGRIASTDR